MVDQLRSYLGDVLYEKNGEGKTIWIRTDMDALVLENYLITR